MAFCLEAYSNRFAHSTGSIVGSWVCNPVLHGHGHDGHGHYGHGHGYGKNRVICLERTQRARKDHRLYFEN